MNEIKLKINALLAAIQEKEPDASDAAELMDDVKATLSQCNDYVNIVASEEQRIQVARARMDARAYRDFVMSIDRTRRYAHEGLMVSINVMNRLAKMYGVEKVADVDPDNRESYYIFAKKVVDEYYTTGSTGSGSI